MFVRKRASRTAGLALGLALIVCTACGGASTAAKPTPRLEPLEVVQLNNQAWVDWKEAGGKFLDRDFFDCYELNGVPRPSVTPVPDPSGHSRSRRGCDEAIAAIEKALPDYQRLADQLKSATIEGSGGFRADFEAVNKARAERLIWAQAVVTAWKGNSTDTLQSLRLRIPELEALEVAALGVDLSSAGTPVPRPTFDYIPGVPTGTPVPGR